MTRTEEASMEFRQDHPLDLAQISASHNTNSMLDLESGIEVTSTPPSSGRTLA